MARVEEIAGDPGALRHNKKRGAFAPLFEVEMSTTKPYWPNAHAAGVTTVGLIDVRVKHALVTSYLNGNI